MIEISGWTILVQFISFLVLMGVLTKFLFKPLSKFIEARRKKIDSTFSFIRDEEIRIARMMEEGTKKLKEAEAQSVFILENALKEGEKRKEEIIKEALIQAKEEANSIIASARDEIRKEKESALEEIANISCAIASKLIKERIDAQKADELLKEFIDSISKEEVVS